MLAEGILAALALSIASRSVKFMSGSAPLRAAIAMALPSLVNTAPRAASLAPFSRLIVLHLLCPDIETKLLKVNESYLLLYQFLDVLSYSITDMSEQQQAYTIPPSRL